MAVSLEERAAQLPRRPGVYLFKDADGTVLYVGKARDLRARVRQYLAGTDGRFMVRFLVASSATVDTVLTDTEKEALILENSLIKQHLPPYNVKLRDDKNFLHLRINPRARWPRYHLVRNIRNDGATTFGPYSSAQKARRTLAFLQRAFPLRTCSDQVLASRKTPCLLFQMKRCVAPCVDGHTTKPEYDALVSESMMVLDGRSGELATQLRARMRAHADALEFEDAARMRDLVVEIEQTLERQKVVDSRLGDRDVWGVFTEGDHAAICVMPVRAGMLLEPTFLRVNEERGALAEHLSSWLNTWYDGREIPPEILLPDAPLDTVALAEVLGERRGGRVQLKVPQRGDKVRLLSLATRNAQDRFQRDHSKEQRLERALTELAELCGLDAPPHRIECVDNSNIQGTSPVASCVVFLDGQPAKSLYRHYKIKTVEGPDDYASMAEVLQRRFRRAAEESVFPDLLVVDGGLGQLNVALQVLAELGLEDQPVIGLAKPRTEKRRGEFDAVDKIVLPGGETLRQPDNSPALNVLRHIRDESHRFAVSFHRRVRRKGTLGSVLEGVPGVGPKRRKALLIHFGSAKRVLQASLDELEQVPGLGKRMAAQIHATMHPAETQESTEG